MRKAVKWQGFVQKDMPIHISNIALFDEVSWSWSRVGIRVEKWKRVRFFKKSWKLTVT